MRYLTVRPMPLRELGAVYPMPPLDDGAGAGTGAPPEGCGVLGRLPGGMITGAKGAGAEKTRVSTESGPPTSASAVSVMGRGRK